MKRYVIKKNPGSTETPWLGSFTDINGGKPCWCSLPDLLIVFGGKIITFDSIREAQGFIDQNQGSERMCYNDSLVCELIVNADSVEIKPVSKKDCVV